MIRQQSCLPSGSALRVSWRGHYRLVYLDGHRANVGFFVGADKFKCVVLLHLNYGLGHVKSRTPQIVNQLKFLIWLIILSSFLGVLIGHVPCHTAEVGDKFAPLVELVLEVFTLDLSLVHKVLYQRFTIAPADSTGFVQYLIREKVELFSHICLLLRLSRQHELEGFGLISL